MKILQINKYHYLRGGSETVFFNTMRLLEQHGHEVIPFCVKHPKNLSSSYERYFVDVPEISDMRSVAQKIKAIPRFISNREAARQLERLIEEQKPDVAQLHNVFNGLSLSILPVLSRRNVPIVATVHDTRFICPSSYFLQRGKWCKNCRRSLYLNCALHRCRQNNLPISIMSAVEMIHKDFIAGYDKHISSYLFLSRRFMRLHKNIHDYFADKGVILPNFFSALSEVKPCQTHDGYYLYYGRLTSEKGIGTLMEAIKRMPGVKFKVAGTGPMKTDIENAQLPNVQYLGFVSGAALDELISKAKMVIVPSEWEENNPMTVIEAYGHGTPVIGSDMGGIPEIISDGETGFVFKAFSPDALCQTIAQAETISSDQYKSLSLQARRYAEKHFNPEVYYGQLMQIYKTAIDGKTADN